MKKIRSAIVSDKSLSTYAHNVKVISQHGQVTLKGPVHSDDERKSIEAKAVEVAGSGNVTNQLSVKGDKPSRKKKTNPFNAWFWVDADTFPATASLSRKSRTLVASNSSMACIREKLRKRLAHPT